MSEYLADDLSAKLHKHLGLPEPETGPNKRKQLTSANTNTDLKRSKTDAQPQEPVKNGALDLSKPEKVTVIYLLILHVMRNWSINKTIYNPEVLCKIQLSVIGLQTYCSFIHIYEVPF